MTTKYISTTDTAKLIRAHLAGTFPNIAFSVRSDSYSMGSSIDVYWFDGPTEDMVKRVLNHYEGSTFDGMQDLKSSVSQIVVGPDGPKSVNYGSDYVHARRLYSADFLEVVAGVVCAQYESVGISAPMPEIKREHCTNPACKEMYADARIKSSFNRSQDFCCQMAEQNESGEWNHLHTYYRCDSIEACIMTQARITDASSVPTAVFQDPETHKPAKRVTKEEKQAAEDNRASWAKKAQEFCDLWHRIERRAAAAHAEKHNRPEWLEQFDRSEQKTVKDKGKSIYINMDKGGSGRYMLQIAPGKKRFDCGAGWILSIKGYGVPGYPEIHIDHALEALRRLDSAGYAAQRLYLSDKQIREIEKELIAKEKESA